MNSWSILRRFELNSFLLQRRPITNGYNLGGGGINMHNYMSAVEDHVVGR